MGFGQYVTIPDAQFAAFLQQQYPMCMIGNQMDTTCPNIVFENALTLSIGSGAPVDISGIRHFVQLFSLNINSTNIEVLDELPPNLEVLELSFTDTDTITSFPVTLKQFSSSVNDLRDMAILPPNLESLLISFSSMTEIPSFPPSLESVLLPINTQLVSIPSPPPSLKYMDLWGCQSLVVPLLVSSNLEELGLRDMGLDSLISLPNSLRVLEAEENNLTAITTLPDSLRWLIVTDNLLLSSITNLPGKLDFLNAANCNLSALPVLPNSVRSVLASNNNIEVVPNLSNSLTSLKLYNNPLLDSLPPLPNSLLELDIRNCAFTSLPALPNQFENLVASNNQIDTIASFGSSIEFANLIDNNLSYLPQLPQSLTGLYLSQNNIRSLPELPQNLNQLWLNNNNISSLPELPLSLTQLQLTNNPISCLPFLKNVEDLRIDSTNITCVPSKRALLFSVPPLAQLTECNLFNSNGCTVYEELSGVVYLDDLMACKRLPNRPISNAKIALYANGQLQQQTYSSTQGEFFFTIDTLQQNYEIRIDTIALPFAVHCPDSLYFNRNVTSATPTYDDLDFALTCGDSTFYKNRNYLIEDITRSVGWFRPASFHQLNVNVSDLITNQTYDCFDTSGVIQVTLTGPAKVDSFTGVTPTSVVGNVFTWEVTNFNQITSPGDISVAIQIDTFNSAGEFVCVEVVYTINGTIENPLTNSFTECFEVVNSYDPNDKQVHPADFIDTLQDWLNYTVRFQNTGNAPAQHVVIEDTLSQFLDWTSFELLSYSHNNNTTIGPNGEVRFAFPYIELPDSNSNEPESHGYVRYRIKPLQNLPLGTAIENTAFIYFDFNPPIITNTTVNTVSEPLPLPNILPSLPGICTNDTLTLRTLNNAGYTFQWYYNGIELNNATTSQIDVILPGQYQVRVANAFFSKFSSAFIVELLDSSLTLLNETICSGDDFSGFSQPGNYTFNLSKMNGCDSTVMIDLIVLDSSLTMLQAEICSGESYAGYTIAGTYSDVYTKGNGCDSTRIIELAVNDIAKQNTTTSITQGDSVLIGGEYQTTAGIYNDTLLTNKGCDSIVITELSVVVSIPTLTNNNIKIYPNPTTDQLTIEWSGSEATLPITIYNQLGQVVLSNSISIGKNSLDVSGLPAGVYVLRSGEFVQRVAVR